MRKVGLCLFYGLCVFAIVFSLYWISLPQLRSPAPQEALPDLPSQQTQAQPGSAEGGYYLKDDGGQVAVYACDAQGRPTRRLALTGIYTNLLPETDALRIKQGLHLPTAAAVDRLLEDLGA